MLQAYGNFSEDREVATGLFLPHLVQVIFYDRDNDGAKSENSRALEQVEKQNLWLKAGGGSWARNGYSQSVGGRETLRPEQLGLGA